LVDNAISIMYINCIRTMYQVKYLEGDISVARDNAHRFFEWLENGVTFHFWMNCK
jgi:tartrate dehydratase beta subunit/fumarate hydratase class I family protein